MEILDTAWNHRPPVIWGVSGNSAACTFGSMGIRFKYGRRLLVFLHCRLCGDGYQHIHTRFGRQVRTLNTRFTLMTELRHSGPPTASFNLV